MINPCCAGSCQTTVIWRCHKPFSQWQRSFQRKLRSHWLKFLWQHHVAAVRQGPGSLCVCNTKLVFTAPADILAPDAVRPSTDSVWTTLVVMILLTFLVVMILLMFLWLQKLFSICMFQQFRRHLSKCLVKSPYTSCHWERSMQHFNLLSCHQPSEVQYIPRNMHTVLLCFALLWLCNRS